MIFVAQTANNELISQYLSKFDAIGFTVFSNQQWVRLHENPAKVSDEARIRCEIKLVKMVS